MSQTTPSPDGATTPVADLSYEQARDELVALVARIESGQVPLEEAMVLWERGEALAAHCQAKLDAAQETLDRAGDREDAPPVRDGSSPSSTDVPATGAADA